MPEAFRLRQVLVNDESTFGADSATYGTKIPINSATFTPDATRIEDTGHRERQAAHNPTNIGLRSGTLEFNVNWVGHFTTSAGALTATWLHNLIGDGLGGKNSAQVGASGGVGATAVTDENIGSDHTATLVAGGVIRVGAKGDGGGDGQCAAVDTTAGALLTALPAVPNAVDDVGACLMQYHDESLSTSLTSKRFLIMHATTGAQYRVLGAQLSGLAFSMPMDNTIPTVTLSYSAAYYNRTATTYPETSTTLGSHEAAPIAAGSFFLQDQQAATSRTNNTETTSEITLNVNLGLSEIRGPGGVNAGQNIVGWARTDARTTLEISIPWVSTYETWWDTDNDTITNKHALFTANTIDGRTVGFYCPNLRPMGQRPDVPVEVNEQNFVKVMFNCDEGTDTATELTRSAVRFFAG